MTACLPLSFVGNKLSYNYFTYHLQLPLLSPAATSPITYSCLSYHLQLPLLSLTATSPITCSCLSYHLQLLLLSLAANSLYWHQTAAHT